MFPAFLKIFALFALVACVNQKALVKKFTKEQIVQAMQEKGHEVFTGENELNIVGVRNLNSNPDQFSETLALFFTKNEVEHFVLYSITTLPNSYFLKNPVNPKGTAILMEGQYKGWKTYIRDSGQYHALMQPKDVSVYRDNNKDKKVDLDPATVETGYFEIELHKANNVSALKKQSAGCQVFKNAEEYFGFMEAVRESIYAGKEITYTLINENDLLQTQ
jgi:hypothetical protein